MPQVRHAVHEDNPRSPPTAWYIQGILMNHYAKTRTASPRVPIGLIFGIAHRLESPRQCHRIAVVAAQADLVAASGGVPRGLGPLDRTLVCHTHHLRTLVRQNRPSSQPEVASRAALAWFPRRPRRPRGADHCTTRARRPTLLETPTSPTQPAHTVSTGRVATVRPPAAPLVPPACGDPLRGSASAVPDLTLTPRGPRGRGRERLRQMVVQAGAGGNHRGTSKPGSRGSPRTPLPSAPPARPVGPLRGGNLLARAGCCLTRNYTSTGRHDWRGGAGQRERTPRRPFLPPRPPRQ